MARTSTRQGAQAGHGDWIGALRRYLLVASLAHLAWEIGQLPLYSIWRIGSVAERVFAVLHCTGGDVLIASSSLLTALVLVGRQGWPGEGIAHVTAVTIVIGLGYTVYSEWLNTSVRMSWAYSEWMPVLPVIGIGVSPLAQWIVVPRLSLWAAHRLNLKGMSQDKS